MDEEFFYPAGSAIPAGQPTGTRGDDYVRHVLRAPTGYVGCVGLLVAPALGH